MNLRKLCASLGPILALMFVLCAGVPNARGQAASTGAILGTVSDPTGAVVPDADVSVMDIATGVTRSAHTDAAGLYDIEALTAAGNLYNLTVKKEGFKTSIHQGVKLDPGARVSVNVTLELGATVSEVSVVAAAVQVETTSGASAGTISGTEVSELQLNGRDFRGLALLIPGVNSSPCSSRTHSSSPTWTPGPTSGSGTSSRTCACSSKVP